MKMLTHFQLGICHRSAQELSISNGHPLMMRVFPNSKNTEFSVLCFFLHRSNILEWILSRQAT
jgi:hypothetical protein